MIIDEGAFLIKYKGEKCSKSAISHALASSR
jgi:hypothetical protein